MVFFDEAFGAMDSYPLKDRPLDSVRDLIAQARAAQHEEPNEQGSYPVHRVWKSYGFGKTLVACGRWSTIDGVLLDYTFLEHNVTCEDCKKATAV